MVPEYVLNDPRLVTKKVGGAEYKFWLGPQANRIARVRHGFDPPNMSEEELAAIDNVENVLRTLWVAHLPFEPDLPFEDFEVRFLAPDFELLTEAMTEIVERQFPKPKEKPAEGEDEEPKKTTRGSRKK